MSIIVGDLSYHHSNQQLLFNHLNFSVEKQEKISIVGNNGVGKTTLLRLMAGLLTPSEGNINYSQQPYYIPQHTGSLNQCVSEAMRVNHKLSALHSILNGSVSQSDYDTLADDWDIESKCLAALAYWQIPDLKPEMAMDSLSGGEKTKVFLAGLTIHEPDIILLDEPSNHLDEACRKLLYQYIEQSKATIIIVSHDIILLNQLQATYQLSEYGIKRYGGNYSFFEEQKEIEDNALNESIHDEEKALRLARKKAQEIKQRQEKRLEKGQKNKSEVPRIFKKTLTNSSENTGARLKSQHDEIISNTQTKLAGLRQRKSSLKDLKIDFDNASLHPGKLLVETHRLNFEYESGKRLWKEPLNFKLYSNDRVHILGNNGSGKTTLIKLLTGSLMASAGSVHRTNFNWIYLDQNYTQVDLDCTIEQLVETYNLQQLKEHEVRLRLNRFLFPSNTLNKNCKQLSGGEKMRLYLCCLMISNQTPDLIILDEPTNNLDISSLSVLSQTIKNYQGSLLVISHDKHFTNEIGVTGSLILNGIIN